MTDPLLDRRSMLRLGGGLWASTLLSLELSAFAARAADNRTSGTLAVLDEPLARTLEAVTARILPTTETQGAREAGAIWFIDAILANDLAEALPLLRAGASGLDDGAPGSFAERTPAQQDAQLRSVEDSEFFDLMHFLTLAGTFTQADYGGNRGGLGWDLLGFDRRHHWTPPFGFYDAAAAEGRE